MPHDSAELLKRLRATFMLEAAEHCEAMSTALLELENAPEENRRALIEKIFRCAHSLKGAARAVNHTSVEAICQQLESVFDAWKRRRLAPAPAAFDVLHRAIERARALAPASEPEPGAATKQLDLLLDEIERIAAPAAGSAPPPPLPPAAPPRPSPAPAPAPSATPPSEPPAPARAKAEPPPAETIRVATGKVERTLYATEELLALKATLAQRVAELRDVADLVARSRREWATAEDAAHRTRETTAAPVNGHFSGISESAVADLLARCHAAGRDAEQKLATLVRDLDRDRHGFGKTVDYLLDETKKLLLLPFATDAGFYSKLVRDLARDQGKQVEFVFRGGEVELDKRILEEIKDPLVHLLRNAIDHGMERPDERTARGKPARGHVTLAASRIDEKVEILIADDGGGVDFAAVRQAIVRRGLQSENAVAKLSDEDALGFIFRSDVTTAPIVTEVSGRGVGLAIVEEVVERLNGRVTAHSEPGRGTSFRIVLPVAQNAFRGILVSIADHVFVLPAPRVQRVHRATLGEIQSVENRPMLMVEGRPIAFAWLSDVLQLPRRAAPNSAKSFLELAIVGPPDRSVAFAVDAVLGEEELLVKPLRPPLTRVRNIAGATVLGNGRVALILHAADLIESAAAEAGRTVAAVPAARPEAQRRSILVVEDSITSRMLLKNILESAGYAVKTAVDGLDAITTLRSEAVDLVVSDVEMPRMNGFGLTAAMRADRRLAEIPVVLVTALANREDRERGIDVGANAYLVKSDFDQSNLLETVQRFL